MSSGYWFRNYDVPALVRPISALYECGDAEILARVITVEIAP